LPHILDSPHVFIELAKRDQGSHNEHCLSTWPPFGWGVGPERLSLPFLKQFSIKKIARRRGPSILTHICTYLTYNSHSLMVLGRELSAPPTQHHLVYFLYHPYFTFNSTETFCMIIYTRVYNWRDCIHILYDTEAVKKINTLTAAGQVLYCKVV
jgi:hypothetical protein